MGLFCQQDERRDAVRRMPGRNGIDYVEVGEDQLTLEVHFLGKLPPELRQNRPGIERHLRIEGGLRVRNIAIADVDPMVDPDPEKDDLLVVRLGQYGDFSTYTLRLVGVEGIDPHHDRAEFSFKIGCPSDLDCAPADGCPQPTFLEPEANYLAKDYGTLRQLLLDRLALLAPTWRERHAADLGIALVELLAYAGDDLSYYQDAVATEAYLDTARQRISVRRHARLVDYRLHEGCNARAWVCLEVSADVQIDPGDASFITGLNDALAARQAVLSWDELREVPPDAYEVFEPLVADAHAPLQLRAAHNEIAFYSWGNRECCLVRGSTKAALRDDWLPAALDRTHGEGAAGAARTRALDLEPGDVLIFEEVRSPSTGLAADASRARRHAVRLTRVTHGEDPVVVTADGRPTPYLEVEWAPEDALPFPLCISAVVPSAECPYLDGISVARGNVVLVDHGKTLDPVGLGGVGAQWSRTTCECAGHPGEPEREPAPFRPRLAKAPLTFREPLAQAGPGAASWPPATQVLTQDVRAAMPQVRLCSTPAQPWEPRWDLIGSWADDRHFVVEVDDQGLAHLRFGDGELGYRPPVGMTFTAICRVGNGARGNVGAEAISRLVLKRTRLSGVTVSVRNPLPARGGTEPEPVARARILAPHQFRTQLQRAIIAEDYEQLAELAPDVQQAAASLAWTGSWIEAEVAVDPRRREETPPALLADVAARLDRARRMGHDVRVVPARYVPLDLRLEVCALPHHQRGHVQGALLDLFSARNLPGGKRGFFHPDELTFGQGIALTRIIAAAQAVPGVESVTVTRFHRLSEPPNRELENGLLPLGGDEIAQLDNDPNHPERGKLEILVRGGR